MTPNQRYKKLEQHLKQENPVLVLMISLTHPENRAVCVACQRLNIPVYYLMHGVMSSSKKENDKKITASMKSTRHKFIYKLSKISKFYFLFKEYYFASEDSMDTFGLVKEFIVNPYKFMWSPNYHRSLQVTKALLYSKSDLTLFRDVFKVDNNRLILVGNPKLDLTFDFEENKDFKSYLPEKYFLYIDQALVEGQFISEKENARLILELVTVAKKFNYELIVKLHPRANKNLFIKHNENVKFIVDEIPLLDLINFSKIVLGHFSSVLIESLALRKPTFSLLYFLCFHFTGNSLIPIFLNFKSKTISISCS